MSPAGYSGTPLVRKLGIKVGHRVALLGAPAGFEAVLGALPEDVTLRSALRGKLPFDVILLFCPRQKDMHRRFASAADLLQENGGLWIAWPTKSSGVATDLGEANVREFGLEQGLVDNKICAVDEVWSGLRFVVRVKDRRRQ